MPGDLFLQDNVVSRSPRRSPVTIAGSVLAHAAILMVLVVLPTLSALDNFVLHADDSMTFVMPAATLPPSPPRPRPDVAPKAPPLNPHAAPLTAAEHPATNVELSATTTTGSTPPESIVVPDGRAGFVPPGAGGPGVVISAPPAPPVGPRRPGGDLKFPDRTTYVPPIYPPLAKAIKLEGSVIIEATIDELGIVRDVHVLRSQPMFDQAALDAVKQWRYAPTRLNGVAVPVILTVTVMFTMK